MFRGARARGRVAICARHRETSARFLHRAFFKIYSHRQPTTAAFVVSRDSRGCPSVDFSRLARRGPSALRASGSSARRRCVSLERGNLRSPMGVKRARRERRDRRERRADRDERERREREARQTRRRRRRHAAKTEVRTEKRKQTDAWQTAINMRTAHRTALPLVRIEEKRGEERRRARRGEKRRDVSGGVERDASKNASRMRFNLLRRLRRHRGGEPPEDFARGRGERVSPFSACARDPKRHAAPRLVREPELSQARRGRGERRGVDDASRVRGNTERERERVVRRGRRLDRIDRVDRARSG